MSVCLQCIYAQKGPIVLSSNDLLFGNAQFIQTDSGLIINIYYRQVCKNYSAKTELISNHILLGQVEHIARIAKELVKPKLITLHGNISYDFFYRSKIDTPYSQQNLQQHTERVWLDVLFKEKYPFKVSLTARQSNSPFFRDLVNLNLNFDKYSFNKNLKQDLLNRLETVKWQNPDLKMINADLEEKLKRYQVLKTWLNSSEILERIVQERERVFYNKQKEASLKSNLSIVAPSYQQVELDKKQFLIVKKDSLVSAEKENILSKTDSSFYKVFQSKKDELQTLEKSIDKVKHQSDSLKSSITQTISKIKQSIYKASNPKELEKIANQNGISELKKEKLQNFLSNIKNLGIGRTMVDYTELTAQNVMLTGINIEYNPSYYAAFAAGKIDYEFRDFFGRGIKQKNQYLSLGRFGWGDKDKRSVILTVFKGRKNNYAGLLAADSNNNTANLFGYSIETIIKKNENTFFTVEVAKSTKNNNALVQLSSKKSDNLFKFSDVTNMGVNIKAETAIPETNTILSGFFRKTGESFQSFSLFTYNTNQQAWQVRVDQSFIKRKINVTTMLRQNEFTNPLADQSFKTSTIFKSLQLNVRVPHWPVINAGYYPGSQFYIVDNNTVRENAYYILNGSVLHAYRVKDLAMNSSFIYNRYFNKATDSGFVLYEGINYILSHSLVVRKLQMEGSYTYNKQAELNYYTVNANGDYSLKHHLRVGGGIKYNHVQRGLSYWGGVMRLSADFKSIGGLQLRYEKSFLPTIQQTLYPLEIGRVSWYKNF